MRIKDHLVQAKSQAVLLNAIFLKNKSSGHLPEVVSYSVMQNFIKTLQSIHCISSNLLERLSKAELQRKRYYKYIHLVIPEMKYREALFVQCGILKASILNENGDERVLCFWTENEFVLLEDCFFDDKPSEVYISPVENGQALVIKREQVERYVSEYPELTKHSDLVVKRQNAKREALLTIIGKQPGERYDLFRNAFPLLWYRLSDRDICSFLCISAKTLSRSKNSYKTVR